MAGLTSEQVIAKRHPEFRYEVLLPSGDVVEVEREVYLRQDNSLRRIVRWDQE